MDLAITSIGVAVIFWIVGLVDIFRYRNRMSIGPLAVWLLVIFLIPFIGVVSWFVWRFSRSEALIEGEDMGSPSPDDSHVTPPQ